MMTRSEHEMLKLIIGTANDDANIRAVILEGSRANPNATKDPFQDFDVVYSVTKLEPYKNNSEWIKKFGELMILQMPDLMGEKPEADHKFTYLMQFMDGNRIDLNLCLVDYLKRHGFGSLRTILLDKDNLFTQLDPSSERDYLPQQPTKKEFFDCCNEFWWVAPYVAKGLWRDDMGYARYMLEHVLREEVMKMMTWYFGIKTNFQENSGKHGKNFHIHVESELCDLLISTFADADIGQTWHALDKLCVLFRKAGARAASHFGYDYPTEDDKRVSAHLLHVRNLAKDAKNIY
jgi:aminoglycoside 6-adenylyltransferase